MTCFTQLLLLYNKLQPTFSLHLGLLVKIIFSCKHQHLFVGTYSISLPPPHTSPHTSLAPSSQSSTWPRLSTLSGCRGRRWRRCPCGWPVRPSPSCSPGRSRPRCAPPAAPLLALRPGAGCSAPPCPPGRPSAGRSRQTAVRGREGPEWGWWITSRERVKETWPPMS